MKVGIPPLVTSHLGLVLDIFYYALLFVAFDVETILIFPWAVAHGYISSGWGLLPFVGVLFLLFVLTIAFIYVWLKGCLEWIK